MVVINSWGKLYIDLYLSDMQCWFLVLVFFSFFFSNVFLVALDLS